MSLRQHAGLIFLLLAIALLAATFLRPSMQLEQPTFRYLFVFDISQSMNVRDAQPGEDSPGRLDYAKAAIWQSLSRMPCGTEVSYALFAGHRAFLLITPVELCAHYGELDAMLKRIDWTMTWESRSEVAKGVFKSIALAKHLPPDTRVVFVSDGHEAPPINPDVPPSFTGDPGEIKGLIIGVGGDKPVPIPKFDENGEQIGEWQADEVMHVDSFTADQLERAGQLDSVSGTEHLSSLREDYLKSISAQTGLKYHRLGSVTSLNSAMTTRELGIPKTVAADLRWAYAVVALILLLVTLISNRRSFTW